MRRMRTQLRSPMSPPGSARTSISARSGVGVGGDRRADKLYPVVARPFGGAGHGADFATIAVDNDGGRHAKRFAGFFQVLENFGALVGVISQVRNADLFEERDRLLRIAGVDIDGDDLEIRPPQR